MRKIIYKIDCCALKRSPTPSTVTFGSYDLHHVNAYLLCCKKDHFEGKTQSLTPAGKTEVKLWNTRHFVRKG